MGETAPLDELATRKRIIRAKMELHRTEMALYYREITTPIENARRRVSKILTHPATLATAVAGVGFLLATRRFGLIRKAAKWITPVVLPAARSFLTKRLQSATARGVLSVIRPD